MEKLINKSGIRAFCHRKKIKISGKAFEKLNQKVGEILDESIKDSKEDKKGIILERYI